ncbi:hypothetical protein K501DRAFT_221802 [Backusella circina FSU 941]|nr:hypothetical protein K501DRAFT_221802 [Backusella circina FSU 941]
MIAKAIGLGFMGPNDDIRILHIVNQNDYRTLFSPLVSANGTSGTHHDFAEENMIGAADDLIWQVIHVLKKRGFQHVSSEVIKGDPKESIVDYCRLSKPAYMITGTRGLGAVKSAVMGSVSKFLINHCPCPVLVIKLEPEEIEARKQMTDAKNATFEHVLARFTQKK